MINKELFCEQIRITEKAMYHLAFSILKNDEDAGDAISEAILRAYKNFDTLKDIESFKPWILRIVHNTSIEIIRKNQKLISLDEVEITTNNQENSIVSSISLQEAINSLKQPYSTVVTLYYYEGLSISQIAKITNTTIVTVKQRLSRSRKQLRKILKEDFRYE